MRFIFSQILVMKYGHMVHLGHISSKIQFFKRQLRIFLPMHKKLKENFQKETCSRSKITLLLILGRFVKYYSYSLSLVLTRRHLLFGLSQLLKLQQILSSIKRILISLEDYFSKKIQTFIQMTVNKIKQL